ncbi:hypothetical protein P7C71_g2413, partial [Lecanoromycetidae sp. Uapishka_2]
MADPFSIIAGAAGLADVCIRLTKFLKQAKDGFQKVDKDLEDLSKEITALRSISDLVQRSFEADLTKPVNPSDKQVIANHWETTQTTLVGCRETTEQLNLLVVRILDSGTSRHVKLNSLRKYLKQQSKEDEFIGLRKKLNAHQTALQTSLAAVNIFWGVFWIDASSKEHAKQSFSTLSRIGKVEPNERAAKSWLSSLGGEKPWLLIIDNADEISFPVEECFPDGDRGFILITTRNPTVKVQGTVGPRSFNFAELDETASIELLLGAADEQQPWSQEILVPAKNICRTLGYLPLALEHAGKAILARLCTIENFLIFFEKNWTRIRRSRSSNDARSVSDANAAIYSSYELIHDGLVAKGTQASDDAMDLLKIFSFLHRQRIRVDIFLRAASSPELEALEQKRREEEEKRTSSQTRPRTTWTRAFQDLGFGILTVLLKLGYRPVLPRMLSDSLGPKPFDELRLREALKELFQMSLIFANPDPTDDSYSMHPAVHLWVRERPEMTIADQAIWCQATATILAQAILIPPLGDKEEDEVLRRDLLPHMARGEEAAELQQQALEACTNLRGKNDLKTLKIMDYYGSSRWQQGRIPEARRIHETAVEGLRKVLGDDHVDTLRAMGNLGRAVGKDFKFTAAIRIHNKVVSGLRSQLGPSHLDTLIAMDNLAMAYFDRAAYGYGQPGDLDHAVKMELEVFELRKEKLGREHLYTLWAGLNLARIKCVRGEVDKALSVFLPGHAIARRNLGENHFGVLFGKMHYGRILLYAKRYQEAEEVLCEVIESHAGPRKGHPDRLIAMMSLIKCRNLLGKQAQTTALLEELTESTIALFGADHPWVKYALDPQNLSKEPDEEAKTPVESLNVIPESLGSGERMTPVAMIAKYGHI